MSTITLDGASGFLTRAKHPRAGVVLLPTIYGVNPFMKEFAAHLAEAGLTSLVWDPYPDEPPPAGFDAALKRGEELRDGPSLDGMAMCIDYLMGELRLDAVGTLGFCLGGRYCLLLAAREKRLGACVSVYPSIHSPRRPNQDEDAIARAADIACPVHVVYPGRDNVTNNEVFYRLQQTLQQRQAQTMVQLFPAADHGFMHNPGAINQTAAQQTTPLATSFLQTCLA
jgi:carboxymethylenebutenolidase